MSSSSSPTLMGMPAEIRLRMYTDVLQTIQLNVECLKDRSICCLDCNHCFHSTTGAVVVQDSNTQYQDSYNVLIVNKQMRQEAMALFYKSFKTLSLRYTISQSRTGSVPWPCNFSLRLPTFLTSIIPHIQHVKLEHQLGRQFPPFDAYTKLRRITCCFPRRPIDLFFTGSTQDWALPERYILRNFYTFVNGNGAHFYRFPIELQKCMDRGVEVHGEVTYRAVVADSGDIQYFVRPLCS